MSTDYFALALQQLREHERKVLNCRRCKPDSAELARGEARGMEERAKYGTERDRLCPLMSRPDLGCWDSNGRWNGHEVACYKNRCALWFDGACAFAQQRWRRVTKFFGCHVPED